jgi:hypothetical protein
MPQYLSPPALSPPAPIGSNPDRTDVIVWESLSVYLRKVGCLFPNALYKVSGFSLPPITTRHHITENCCAWQKILINQSSFQSLTLSVSQGNISSPAAWGNISIRTIWQHGMDTEVAWHKAFLERQSVSAFKCHLLYDMSKL